MKIKLILVLSLLFNSIILNSCGPAFFRQTEEDYSQPISRQEALQIEMEQLRRENRQLEQKIRQLVQNFDNMLRFIVGISASPENLSGEIYLKIWRRVRSLPPQLPAAK